MKSVSFDEASKSSPDIEPQLAEAVDREPENAPRDFPFRLIRNENYRPVQKPKKWVKTNDDEMPPAA